MILTVISVSCLPQPCLAQRGKNEPNVGYVYPAGGRVGTEFTVEIGGQYLSGVLGVHVSGDGVQATVLKHIKPLTGRERTLLSDKLKEAREKIEETRQTGKRAGRRPSREAIAKVAMRMGVAEDELIAFEKYRRQQADKKRQLNPQLSESVILNVRLDADAKLGKRELRLRTPNGLSNPLHFMVGQWPEHLEAEPNDQSPEELVGGPFPAVLNGQIMPGDVDRFLFKVKRGDRLVVTVRARDLVPYLADAVPGWFQATIGLFNPDGSEVAYVDDFEFRPDPVLYYKIPRDGTYGLEIKDAIYRGREDFVYRITLGEVPFVTSIFPLGGREGQVVNVELKGWNLPVDSVELEAKDEGNGIQLISVEKKSHESNRVPFAVGTLPECREVETNDDLQTAQKVKPPLIINGRIDEPGDHDVYQFHGRARGTVAIEVTARRLNSPVDSLLKITDSSGKTLLANDDHEDKGAGLTTHHADSMLKFKLPADGDYFVHLLDAQNHGGDAYVYRLRISAKLPEFDLRVVPSSVSVRPGGTVPLTVHALRRDDFNRDIKLELKNAPSGFKLSGGLIPGDQKEIDITLTVPTQSSDKPYEIDLEGFATVKGKEIRRNVVPADDTVQAFITHHLVPADSLLVSISKTARQRKSRRSRAGGQVASALTDLVGKSVEIPSGGVARFRLPLPKRPNLDQVKLELKNPPDGIEIKRVIAGTNRIDVIFSADAAKVKLGQEGNLILEAFVERTFVSANGGKKVTHRIPIATLPAIGFKIKE